MNEKSKSVTQLTEINVHTAPTIQIARIQLGFRQVFKDTFPIEIIALSFETIEIVSLLTNLELKIVNMLKVVLSQTLSLTQCCRIHSCLGW